MSRAASLNLRSRISRLLSSEGDTEAADVLILLILSDTYIISYMQQAFTNLLQWRAPSNRPRSRAHTTLRIGTPSTKGWPWQSGHIGSQTTHFRERTPFILTTLENT